jgi:hypothetical protein
MIGPLWGQKQTNRGRGDCVGSGPEADIAGTLGHNRGLKLADRLDYRAERDGLLQSHYISQVLWDHVWIIAGRDASQASRMPCRSALMMLALALLSCGPWSDAAARIDHCRQQIPAH